MTKVVFRKFKEGGEVIALFPGERWNRHERTISSYMHVGQHGAADYDGVVSVSRPAREEEYRPLFAELTSIGYNDLRVMKRCRPKFD